MRGHDAGGLIHGCSSLDSDTGDDPAGLLNILRRSPSAQVFAWCRNVVFGDPWAITELRPELPLLPVPAAIQADINTGQIPRGDNRPPARPDEAIEPAPAEPEESLRGIDDA